MTCELNLIIGCTSHVRPFSCDRDLICHEPGVLLYEQFCSFAVFTLFGSFVHEARSGLVPALEVEGGSCYFDLFNYSFDNYVGCL